MDITSEFESRESLVSVSGVFGGSSEEQREVKSKPRRSNEGKQPKDTVPTARTTYYDVSARVSFPFHIFIILFSEVGVFERFEGEVRRFISL